MLAKMIEIFKRLFNKNSKFKDVNKLLIAENISELADNVAKDIDNKIKLFDSNSQITKIAKFIMTENITALEKVVSKGFNINAPFVMTKYITETPLILALCENKFKVIDWLLTKNVELNDKNYPSIVMACSNCKTDIVKLLIDKGADVNIKDNVGNSAMSAALYGNNYEVIQLLIDNGYNLKNDGSSLRQAVFDKQKTAINLLLENKINVNYSTPDMVFSFNSTPIHIAASLNDFETVKLLVEHGADVTIKDKYGERPYNCAIDNKNYEMAAYLKAFEPESWHNVEQLLLDLEAYQIPAGLLNILQSDDRKIELKTSENVEYIIFNSILDIKVVNWGNRIFLDLLSEVDNYEAAGFLVWYPKKKRLAFADYEHEEFTIFCTFDEFLKNPSKQIDARF